jgi:hypothetical protein
MKPATVRCRFERRAHHHPDSRGVQSAARRADGRHSDPQPHRDGHLRHQHAHRAGVDLGRFDPGEELEIDFTFECWLTPHQYTVTVATQHPRRLQPRLAGRRDYLRRALARQAAGVTDLRAASMAQSRSDRNRQ